MALDSPVFGVYPTRDQVQAAFNGFRDAGFSDSNISVLLLNEQIAPGNDVTEDYTKAAQGAAVGAGSKAAAGCAVDWLVDIRVLVIPKIGSVIAAGPLVAALAGIGVGGTPGDLTGALVGLGIPESQAKYYEGRLTGGGVLVAIHCDRAESAQRAKEILEITGAEGISSSLLLPQRKAPDIERKTAA